jgi:hypothetical protein
MKDVLANVPYLLFRDKGSIKKFKFDHVEDIDNITFLADLNLRKTSTH